MPATYEPIATTTLGSATATITFSSIPATYTDLRFVIVATNSAGSNFSVRVNGDTGNNYSQTDLSGSGIIAGSARLTNFGRFVPTATGLGLSTTIPHLYTGDLFSYAGSTNKTVLFTNSEDENGNGYLVRLVGLWRNTTAINTIALISDSGTFNIGTTATLYGIKNA